MVKIFVWVSSTSKYISVNAISNISMVVGSHVNMVLNSGELIEIIDLDDVSLLSTVITGFTQINTSDTIVPDTIFVGGSEGLTTDQYNQLLTDIVNTRG